MYLGNAFLGSNSRYSIMMSAHGGGIDKKYGCAKIRFFEFRHILIKCTPIENRTRIYSLGEGCSIH